ncbi:MAG: hypothetical protein OXU66_08705 [Gammaproteobacteria bacterium]|nr:hypothetical protein [Gammaproteobacteria bacterium]MDD9959010.1 hypothetical protein [Gammaproteobacteria bacterium]
MEREKKAIKSLKPLLLGGLVFIALGVSLANEMLGRLGLADNYVIVFSAAFVIAALLLSKNLIMLVLVAIGVIFVNFPDATLLSYGIDRDVLLALVCAGVLVPSLYNLVAK